MQRQCGAGVGGGGGVGVGWGWGVGGQEMWGGGGQALQNLFTNENQVCYSRV